MFLHNLNFVNTTCVILLKILFSLSLFIKVLFLFMDSCLLVHECVHVSAVPVKMTLSEEVVTDGCELPCGLWTLNLGSLQKEQGLLTTEPSRQPQCFPVLRCIYVHEFKLLTVLFKSFYILPVCLLVLLLAK